MAQCKVSVDMAYDTATETPESVLAEISKEFDVIGRVLIEAGPGGGWPEVQLSGSREQVSLALKERWGFDDEDLKDYLLAE
jgi:hypothetical protein